MLKNQLLHTHNANNGLEHEDDAVYSEIMLKFIVIFVFYTNLTYFKLYHSITNLIYTDITGISNPLFAFIIIF